MSVTTEDRRNVHDDHGHGHHPGFAARWLFSTNHKDIGTLYLIFSVLAGLVGGGLSILMRAELQSPGLQIFSSGQEWNAVVTASPFWVRSEPQKLAINAAVAKAKLKDASLAPPQPKAVEPAAPPPPPEDVTLLREIRDLLKERK